MPGGKAEARAKGGNVVVGTVEFRVGEGADGVPGGGGDRGGRGDGWEGDCNKLLVKWRVYCSNHNLRDRS